jgi:gluconate 2-dehydrogenase subunit 3-like protein
MRRLLTRRQALERAGMAGATFAIAPAFVRWAGAFAGAPLSEGQLSTLRAAVARIVPAQGPGDWSAADVGADSYIVTLLAGTGQIYAGGPFRSRFGAFQTLSRVKRIGWSREIRRLRILYRNGLAELDRLALGNFAGAPPELQDVVLTLLDDTGSDFFTALYNHTLEGVYAHPVYGGNRNYRAWQTFGYAGDVHGVRFPNIGPANAPWNVYGGYAPEEMAQPGTEST